MILTKKDPLKYDRYQCVMKEPNFNIIDEFLKKTHPHDYNSEKLLELATECGCTGGKGMFTFPTFDDAYAVLQELTQIWKKNVEDNEMQFKGDNLKKGVYAVYAYTSDFRNKSEIVELRDSIISVCDPAKMFYKPDIYSIFHLGSRNPFGIKPSLYWYFKE